MARVYQTPGVYIEEKNAFPNSAVPVATNVPAFIGYTEQAVRDGKPLLLVPTRISSYGEYVQLFGGAPQTKLTVAPATAPAVPYQLSITERHFTLHRQLKMFFANGGTDCYIVSVGGYTKADGTANTVEAAVLQTGLEPLTKEPEPALLVIPELTASKVGRNNDGSAVENDVKACYRLTDEILNHCGVVTRNRFAILDVWMDREQYQDEGYDLRRDITLFRNSISGPCLDWGAAYYPWLETTVVPMADISVLHVANLGTPEEVLEVTEATFNESGALADPAAFQRKFLAVEVSSLVSLLDKSLNQEIYAGQVNGPKAMATKEILRQIPAATTASAGELTQTLLAVSPLFKALAKDIQRALNLLPPSAAMAGVYSMVDNSVGVFQSPANVSVGSVIRPALSISHEQQEDLNLPPDGKAVNAIRSFPGKGVLVWGARTLDGNSQDWRYVSVRRTVIFIEQSIKYAIEPSVFAPNTAPTWANVKAVVGNFLTNLWQSGGLAGATPDDAFSVDVGLGSTMTPVDILDGYLRVSVKVALTRPAEYIVLIFEQQVQAP